MIQTIVAGLIATLLRPALGRILLLLGLSIVTFEGLDFLIANITTIVSTNLTSGGLTVLSYLGLLKVDVAASIMISAFAIRTTLMITRKFGKL